MSAHHADILHDCGISAKSGALYVVDPIRRGVAYAAIGPTVYQSMDGGKTWDPAGSIREGLGAGILALLPHPWDASILYASAGGGGLYVTEDAGETWRLMEGLPSAWVTALDTAPREPLTLFAGTLEGIPYRSTDGGESWEAATVGLPRVGISALLVDPESPDGVFLGT